VEADLLTDRTRLRRLPDRGRHDQSSVNAILDAAPYCHLGYVDEGQPYVVPTVHARIGGALYVHGSAASRTLRRLGGAIPMCLTATLLDGLVLARSAFHHSMNYRSVMVLGQGETVPEGPEKAAALDAIVDHVLSGRSAQARPGNERERRATLVVRIRIDEASVKVRTGGPKDDEEDLGLDVWAGVVPLALVAGAAQPDSGVSGPIPANVQDFVGR
jgi:uncharacterized protein